MPALSKEAILAVVEERHPSTLADLKKCLEDKMIEVNDAELLPLIKQMRSKGEIRLYLPARASSFEEYITSYWDTWWVYLAVVVAVSESFLVFLESQSGPLLFLRIVFGVGLLGFVPGYLTVRIIFPRGKISVLEQLLLSVFLSVLISIAVGVLLGLGPFFLPSYNTLLMSLYVLVASPVAAYRSYRVFAAAH
ncbi:MAG: hypothetical protein AUI50_03680 [Crenarchaeota archaeon 13_1_40CM_2_52_14]|nr:MAG: hypothetical protein AUI97_00360 [Crenarchaeota archaeon 13_1_40CM_3_52_17]OLD35084.1 MAG: hypothetical protein AUI50_03680 [Crenarchaeota archaeon 13_1_40CM_2_52_14]